jgi:hypothetical protein
MASQNDTPASSSAEVECVICHDGGVHISYAVPAHGTDHQLTIIHSLTHSSLIRETPSCVLIRSDMAAQSDTPASTSAEVECVICYSAIPAASSVELRPCLHSEFCKPCVTSWLTTRQFTCPVCRAYIHAWSIEGVEAGIVAHFHGDWDDIPAVEESVRGALARAFGFEVIVHVSVQVE